MKTQGMLIAAVAASTALGACSSGGGSSSAGRAGNTGTQQVLATTAGPAAQALADDTTLRASQRTSSQWTRDFDADTAALSADSTATIRRNDQGGLDLTVDGRTVSFTAADLTPDGDGFRLPDGSAGIWTWSANTMAEALDPANTDYSLVFDYFVDFDNGTGNNGFALIGTETAGSALGALPTATYTGDMRLRVAPTEGFADFNDSVSEARGDVNLTANFGSGSVSGNVTNMEGRLPSNVDPTRTWTGFSGGLTMAEADITGNGFTGALSGDAGFNAAVGTLDPGSTYSGTFFGPGAEEVGGGINVTGTTAAGDPFLGFGFWQAFD